MIWFQLAQILVTFKTKVHISITLAVFHSLEHLLERLKPWLQGTEHVVVEAMTVVSILPLEDGVLQIKTKTTLTIILDY